MSARSGLVDLIEILRGYTDAGSADYSIGTSNYWDNDHIQVVLDRHRLDIYHEPLVPIENWAGGSIEYREYISTFGYYEKTDGGTAIFIIEDATGADVGTAHYSVDYLRGRIIFNSNTFGSAFYLTGRSYDLNAAAADIWRQKASHYALAYNFSTDSHRLERSKLIEQCLKMAEYYESRARLSTTTLTRSDLNGSALQ